MSYSQFCLFWPKNVVKPKIEDYGSCKCETCDTAELLISALKRQDHDNEIMIRDDISGDADFEKKFEEDLKIHETG